MGRLGADTPKRSCDQLQRLATVMVAVLVLGIGSAIPSSTETFPCVGKKPGCFGDIQSAIDAAPPGSTVRVAAGRYAGGLTIDKDLRLEGPALDKP